MNFDTRKELYEAISTIRKRPLLVYVTSFRVNANASIASDVIPEFIKNIQAIDGDSKELDLLLISYGGDPTVAYRIMSILREKYKKINVLLPYAAYSAATLISLGANEIVMHPFSNLGPVDPQLTHRKQNNEQIKFGSEDLRNYIEFIRNDVGLSDQEQMQKAFEIICKEVGAIPIGIAKRSAQLALSMGEKLLSLHMSDNNKAKAIAETLNKSFYHHGHPIGRAEAKKIGLPVTDAEQSLEELLWKVYESFEAEMLFNEPFDPLKMVLSKAQNAALMGPIPYAIIPQNLPPQVQQAAYNNLLQQIQLVNIEPVDYENLLTCVESVKARSENKASGKIFGNRLPDGNIAVNVLQTSSGWKFFK